MPKLLEEDRTEGRALGERTVPSHGLRIIYSALPITTYKLITTEKTDEGVEKDRPIDYPWEEGLCPLSCLEAQTLLKEQSRS